jgi:hypothetical protein
LTFDEICAAAYKGNELPENIPLHDQLLFATMRHISNAYRSDGISKDQATLEKNRVRYQYNLWKRAADDHLASARRYQEITIATEGMRSEIRKLVRDQAPAEQIINASLRLIGILDGVMLREWKEAAG